MFSVHITTSLLRQVTYIFTFLNTLFLIEHDSGMVQLQVACYKKKHPDQKSDTKKNEISQKENECEIISELLFHNDGATTDAVNNILPQITSSSSPNPEDDDNENLKSMTSISSSESLSKCVTEHGVGLHFPYE